MRKRHLALFILLLGVSLASIPGVRASHEPSSSDGMDVTFHSQNSTMATNSDLAFWGDLAFAGNYDGFRIFDISTSPPTMVADVDCPGQQGDVSVWDRDGNGEADILFLSVDQVMEDPPCGAPPQEPPEGPYDPTDWEGIRIFDITNPAAPVNIFNLSQECGSHTHTLLPDPEDNRVVLYNSSYSLRTGFGCGPGNPQGRHPLHGVIQVSEVSWDPAAPLAGVEAMEIAEPPINYPGDPDNLFDPCHHDLCDPNRHPLRACHDLAVFMELNLVGAACVEQAQLWRFDPVTLIPDTANPLWVFDNPEDTDGAGGGDAAADFWHSATFTWDGRIVNFSDESFGFGSGCPTKTNITDPAATRQGMSDTGRTYFLEANSGRLLSDFMINRPDSTMNAYCSTHQGHFIPTQGTHYMLVQAWYTGGVDIIDLHNRKRPSEAAFFDFAGEGDHGSDNWAHYWYEHGNGEVIKKANMTTYGQDGHSEHGRGFEVFEVFDKDVIKHKRYTIDHLNPQTQEFVLR